MKLLPTKRTVSAAAPDGAQVTANATSPTRTGSRRAVAMNRPPVVTDARASATIRTAYDCTPRATRGRSESQFDAGPICARRHDVRRILCRRGAGVEGDRLVRIEEIFH